MKNLSVTKDVVIFCVFFHSSSSIDHWTFCFSFSSVARSICQEGQSERNLTIFAFSSWFFPNFSWFSPDFSWFFPDFWQFFAVRGGTLPPLPPWWLRHCFHYLRIPFYNHKYSVNYPFGKWSLSFSNRLLRQMKTTKYVKRMQRVVFTTL